MTYEHSISKSLKKAAERRVKGREEYGDMGFKNRNMHRELKEELYDIINYALFEVHKVEELEKKSAELAAEVKRLELKVKQLNIQLNN